MCGFGESLVRTVVRGQVTLKLPVGSFLTAMETTEDGGNTSSPDIAGIVENVIGRDPSEEIMILPPEGLAFPPAPDDGE
jgi:hypothetical protein